MTFSALRISHGQAGIGAVLLALNQFAAVERGGPMTSRPQAFVRQTRASVSEATAAY